MVCGGKLLVRQPQLQGTSPKAPVSRLKDPVSTAWLKRTFSLLLSWQARLLSCCGEVVVQAQGCLCRVEGLNWLILTTCWRNKTGTVGSICMDWGEILHQLHHGQWESDWNIFGMELGLLAWVSWSESSSVLSLHGLCSSLLITCSPPPISFQGEQWYNL